MKFAIASFHSNFLFSAQAARRFDVLNWTLGNHAASDEIIPQRTLTFFLFFGLGISVAATTRLSGGSMKITWPSFNFLLLIMVPPNFTESEILNFAGESFKFIFLHISISLFICTSNSSNVAAQIRRIRSANKQTNGNVQENELKTLTCEVQDLRLSEVRGHHNQQQEVEGRPCHLHGSSRQARGGSH